MRAAVLVRTKVCLTPCPGSVASWVKAKWCLCTWYLKWTCVLLLPSCLSCSCVACSYLKWFCTNCIDEDFQSTSGVKYLTLSVSHEEWSAWCLLSTCWFWILTYNEQILLDSSPVLPGRKQLKFYWCTCPYCPYPSIKGPVCTGLVCCSLLTIEEVTTVNWTLCCWVGVLRSVTMNASEFRWGESVLARKLSIIIFE